jgi:hypothetical protein
VARFSPEAAICNAPGSSWYLSNEASPNTRVIAAGNESASFCTFEFAFAKLRQMMKTASRISAAVVLLTSSVALAQPDAPPPDGTAPTLAPPADGPTPSRYPRDIISRVLTYPAGLVVVGGDVSTSTENFFDPAQLRPLVGYGITDDLEINFADFVLGTDENVRKSINANVGYKLLRGAMDGKLEVIGRVQVGYALEQKVEDVVVAEAGLAPLLLGVQAQYNITPKIAVITPGQQLSIALDGEVKPITFALPVAVGIQLTPTVYAQVDTKLATLEIADAETTVIFSDTTPLALTGFLNAIPALDVFAGLTMDLTPPGDAGVGDTLGVIFGARYYIGQL